MLNKLISTRTAIFSLGALLGLLVGIYAFSLFQSDASFISQPLLAETGNYKIVLGETHQMDISEFLPSDGVPSLNYDREKLSVWLEGGTMLHILGHKAGPASITLNTLRAQGVSGTFNFPFDVVKNRADVEVNLSSELTPQDSDSLRMSRQAIIDRQRELERRKRLEEQGVVALQQEQKSLEEEQRRKEEQRRLLELERQRRLTIEEQKRRQQLALEVEKAREAEFKRREEIERQQELREQELARLQEEKRLEEELRQQEEARQQMKDIEKELAKQEEKARIEARREQLSKEKQNNSPEKIERRIDLIDEINSKYRSIQNASDWSLEVYSHDPSNCEGKLASDGRTLILIPHKDQSSTTIEIRLKLFEDAKEDRYTIICAVEGQGRKNKRKLVVESPSITKIAPGR